MYNNGQCIFNMHDNILWLLLVDTKSGNKAQSLELYRVRQKKLDFFLKYCHRFIFHSIAMKLSNYLN